MFEATPWPPSGWQRGSGTLPDLDEAQEVGSWFHSSSSLIVCAQLSPGWAVKWVGLGDSRNLQWLLLAIVMDGEYY